MYSSNQNRERRLAAYLGIKWAGYSLRRFADHLWQDSVVVKEEGVVGGIEQRQKVFEVSRSHRGESDSEKGN